MSDLISRATAEKAIIDLRLEPDSAQYIWSGDALSAVKNVPTVEAVPLGALCEWLAGYAAPPRYAIDACGGIHEMSDPNKRAEAWRIAMQSMMESGLLAFDEGEDE